MGRRPIGKTAMTDAERQRRRRERLGIGGPYLPNFVPWDQSIEKNGRRDESLIPDRAVSRFIDQLNEWIEGGNIKQVARWLAHRNLRARPLGGRRQVGARQTPGGSGGSRRV
jgi:hypothetical protein